MFRSYSRSWTPDASLTNQQTEDAEDSLEPRVFNGSNWSTYLTANSGPGWRFGLTVGLGLSDMTFVIFRTRLASRGE